ncbi:hypothetical protein FSS13T_25290 [Flavobacterium saliperosum S13]|uniref:Uncharacterized protein n=1 Tax=Flavobacterium saliperosum S13 TaxID=1341155 RepID=A0ABN0QDL8_9FLAO|nr:hypothetical protein FSS13T_25290 [Flavobacterium saliperosum S13]
MDCTEPVVSVVLTIPVEVSAFVNPVALLLGMAVLTLLENNRSLYGVPKDKTPFKFTLSPAQIVAEDGLTTITGPAFRFILFDITLVHPFPVTTRDIR